MIELLEHYFIVLIQCVGAIYFGLGIVLLFGKVPLAAEYLPYRKATWTKTAVPWQKEAKR